MWLPADQTCKSHKIIRGNRDRRVTVKKKMTIDDDEHVSLEITDVNAAPVGYKSF